MGRCPVRFNGRLSSPQAVIVAALALAGPVLAGSARPENRSVAAVTPASLKIYNFGQTDPNYFRGGQPKGSDYADLAALGVRTVIDLTADDVEEPSRVQAAGMKLFRIPMTTHETPSAEKVGRFLQLVNDPANQPVYVHCQGGRHRTGVMTAVYRMTRNGWKADKAFAEMKAFRFGPDFLHPEFKSFVFAFDPQAMRVSTADAGAANAANRPLVPAATTNP